MKANNLFDFNNLPIDCKNNLQSNCYISNLYRLAYVATPKAACTTFKWWFADLIDKTDAICHASGSLESSPELVIHDLFGRISPESAFTSIENFNSVVNATDFYLFCLVRNPFTRIFSAWQSKWLLREPLQVGPYRNCSFYNLSISNMFEVALAFEAFLEHLNTVEYPNILDHHVKSQFSLLCPESIPYSNVCKLEESAKLCEDLKEHLGFAYKSPFSFGKLNESLIPYHPTLITQRSEILIRSIYAVDFDYFGYSTSKPLSNVDLDESVMKVALSAVEMLRGRHQRIGEMRSEYKIQIENSQNNFLKLQLLINKQQHEMDQQQYEFVQLQQKQLCFREEILRAEAQISLLKELLLVDGSYENI